MNPLKKLLEKVEPSFREGGKLHKFWPVYDGFATFLFVPGHPTQKGAHIRDGIDLKRTMVTVILAALPALLFGIYNVGYQHFQAIGQLASASTGALFVYGLIKVLPLIVVSYVVGLGIEFAFCIIKKHQINEGFLVTGILIPMVVPPDMPLWMVAVATAFAVLIGKEVFGGTGMNVLNPALTARAFLFFAYPAFISGDKVWVSLGGEKAVDGFTGATALSQFITQGSQITNSVGQPMGFMEGFIGLIPGSIGETSTLAILIGAVILILTGVGSWRIMLSVFAGGYIMASLLSLLAPSFPDNPYLAVPPHLHLVFGGFAFGAVFMATDPVSAAQTPLGKIIYGFLIGVLCLMIRVLNPAYPEGMMLAILFMNAVAPLIDYYVVQGNIKRRLKRVTVKA
ncbi:MAG: NADH:ubiquinone reductase (Na(+)-transporting) subunit B [Flavobacteriales bacterium]|nr:NADH:ubiquinone reductase (Na(+)-transporting) subunit B [Flavobacteriales bacterium]MCZ2442497.1 NADH:ubiquinone reductase (Na(+)-transporting) subunit B [Flavobacteriales bacterium]